MRYKKIIRQRISHLQGEQSDFTLADLALSLGIDPSYLSRFLGDPDTHFSDDLLYRLAKRLRFSEREFDQLLLNREFDRATQPERRKHLELILRSQSLHRWDADVKRFIVQLKELLRVAEQVNDFAEKCSPSASPSVSHRPKVSLTNKENPMNKTKKLFIVMLATLVVGQANAANAPVNQSTSTGSPSDNRTAKKLGAYIGILGDPHPTVIGINIAYNVLDFMRASLGFGKVSVSTLTAGPSGFATEDTSMTTIGVAAKFLVPGWNLSPSASLGYSHVSIDSAVIASDYKSSNFYLGLGGDWQAESGFNLGAGMNLSLNSGAPAAPYINVGMFF